ncbi:hypothetical protein [Pampinifervens florentissimum]|uniref:hypothetical protein n=1 Tax=Pampinifervens florentissimum TaxID=1632019 RepID=UPI0013B49E48|nr:hypothetical protein [Hydrogenobacter sp. T-8]QID33071.1 hypothetical protein G3M65_04525 [Hydrogenobacter sp. T-8]
MSVSIYVEVSGRTYDVKEKLKSLGLRWDGDRKVWKGTVSEKALRKLGKLADKFPIEIKTRTRKRHELTYEDEVDKDLLEKVYAIVGEKIKAVILYANPYSHYVHDRDVVFTAGELKDGKVKVVARVKGNEGEVLLSENAYKKTAKELLEKAQRVYKSVEDYRLENYLEFLREKEEAERYRYTNSTWVRCWECGRLIPPGQATKDLNGEWYCGC